MSLTNRRPFLLASLVALAGCANSPDDDLPLTYDEAPVSELGPLVDGIPPNAELPDESKADEVYPARFDLLETQTPVRNQGSRGVCSIFATAALMESLYISEGTITSPDFSEQYLQWSVKTEVGAFTNTDGSSAQRNLEAINRFGIVEESLWPYESRGWSTTQDAACTGENRPVRCWTNGEPPAAAREGMRWHLPAGRWIRSTPRSIQGHMVTKRTPVVVGGDFFYQAWNHGGSMLPTNGENSRRGIVMSPNDADIADSRMRPAGHAFLLVGWDSEMEVQRLDGEGNPVVDAMGRPVMERGFFMFKNSWGTTRFGTEGTQPDGYGWISFRYVEQYLTAYVSAVPTVRLPPETCNNTSDDDRDGAIDCEDSDCASDRACMDSTSETTHSAMPMVAIPDNTPAGVSSEIVVAEAGAISSLAVTVDITHTYRGDLQVRLERDGRVVTLLDRAGGADDHVQQTFSVADFNGVDAAGTWRLVVVDTASADVGTLSSWSLAITRCEGASCGGTEQTREHSATPAAAIPDDSTSGVTSDIVVSDAGTISRMSVTVGITHEFPMDLTVRLSRVGGREFVLLREASIDAGSFERTFAVEGFVGESVTGTWRLTVVDGARNDVGTLDRWSMSVTTR
ncbi:proprotein convertase P-domain-containing protein [Sandaracinus amylolyticus]|uniref:Serine protease, subtilase family n=1 Tax=Sandaracinus amylolyticus TaxID=927083 RepID=A0A0F6W911_9BACT|nr:proprotein convertase P-domain-containing protein [Sandaracinus amylolyticus]AKF10556.1 Serine protease, subtilase family [Sandaracinus amylolyticus]